MAFVLHAPKGNSRANKVLVVAEYAGVVVKQVENFQMGVDNKSPEFLAKNPNGLVPLLETEDGQYLYESNAIVRHIARLGNWYGKNPMQTALIDQWIEWSRGDLEKCAIDLVYPIFGYAPHIPDNAKRATEAVKKQVTILNEYLKFRSFLVGDRLSLADVVLACTLLGYYVTVFDSTYRKAIPNVNRWFLTVTNQPNFKKFFPNIELVEKAKTPAPPKEEPKPVVVEKAQPKQEKKEEADEEPAPEKKKANPLDSLPPSKFVLDEWKRTYSNAKDTRDACKWFWENFDPEGYSLWYSEYKYNDELDVVFKSCNLMGGFIQRLESLRKYGFGSLLLFGKDGDLEISGVWVVRGSELPPELTECPDFPSYNFTKMNHSDDAEKAKFDDYLCWDGSFGGKAKPFNQGKNFK